MSVPPISDSALPAFANDTVSAPGATVVKVPAGDTWQIFADAQGVDVKDLMIQNHVDPATSPDRAIPFQALTLPTSSYGDGASSASTSTSKSGLPPAPPDPEAASAMKANLKAKASGKNNASSTTGGKVPTAAVAGAMSPGAAGAKALQRMQATEQNLQEYAVVRETKVLTEPTVFRHSITGDVPPVNYARIEQEGALRLSSGANAHYGEGVYAWPKDATKVGNYIDIEVPPGTAVETLEVNGQKFVRLLPPEGDALPIKIVGTNMPQSQIEFGRKMVALDVEEEAAEAEAELGGKGASAATKATEATGEGAGVAGAGVDTATGAALKAGEEGAVKLAGARVAMEALGFVGFMLEPFEIMGNYFGSFEEAKSAIKNQSYVDGFADGIAAGLKGMSTDDTVREFWRYAANPNMGDRVIGTEGVAEKYHNKGLADGLKYFRRLPPEKQQALRDAAAKNGWDLKKDDTGTLAARGVRPMVVDMFEKAREAAEAAERKKLQVHTPGADATGVIPGLRPG